MSVSIGAREATIDAVLVRAGLAAATIVGDTRAVVAGASHDSNRVVPLDVFFCLRGVRHDGHDFALEAVRRGATVLVVDHRLDLPVTQVVVPDVRGAMGPVSCAVYGDPAQRMHVIGVTGTNGKTTTSHLVAGIFRHVGQPSAVIGTLNGGFTTPEAPELQRRLADMANSGITTVAMEVSSHALVQHRVDGMRFAAAVFTNLGHDHLDLHGSMENYYAAKASLFRPGLADLGVVNADDPAGRRILDEASIPMVPFSVESLSEVNVEVDCISYRWRGRRVRLPIGGGFNVMNSLAAAETAVTLGVGADDVASALSSAEPVPGRFEAVRNAHGFHVIVDYAHTPDGLASVLASAREASTGRVIVVFGCGGNRDRDKRPQMGRVASGAADLVIVTSDNPRGEDPRAIIAEIVAGIPDGEGVGAIVEPDRAIAIEEALRLARPGDVVVLAGKGHETTKTIGDQVIEFDDRAVAHRILENLQ